MTTNHNKEPNKIMTLFALATQMTGAVLGLSAVGYFLDAYFEIEENYLTLTGALLGVIVGMYLLLQGVKSMND